MDPQLRPTKIQSLLDALTVPEEFSKYNSIEEDGTIALLEQWKTRACDVLNELKRELEERDAGKMSVQEQGEIVSKVVVFECAEPWTLKPGNELAIAILQHFPSTLPLLEHLLTAHIKPLFRSNPHPMINPSTGRKLPRAAAAQDFYYYEGQVWKRRPGAALLLEWCVTHVPEEAYERLWHLVVPPMMTLLDDYEAPYKLLGIRVVSPFLARAPPDLLRRTGVDGLLFSSLKSTLSHLHNPTTPSLLLAAVPALLTLIARTTAPGSAARFDQLCTLLGESLIGGVWVYASNDAGAVQASVQVLPEVVRALGVGSVRYLKALISQLTHPLLADSPSLFSTQYKVICLTALQTVIEVCAPRMHRWKEALLEAVAKCWVLLVESDDVPEDDKSALKTSLKQTTTVLAKACPSVLTDEYPRFMAADAGIFSDLFG